MLHFCFNFILFGHRGHVNFHFNWCSVFTEGCFYLWKKFESSKWGSLHLVEKLPQVKFPIPPQPLTAIWKTPTYKILWPLFVDGVQLPQGYTELLWGDSLLFSRNSWYLLNQSRKDERLRWPWNHSVVLNLCINLVITKNKSKSQYVKLTQLWPLTVNYFKVSSQSYLEGLSKICFVCTYVDQMVVRYRLVFCFKFSFTMFLLMFLPLFTKFVNNILKIYELPEIYEILKKLFTIIIYQFNSMSQLYLASELYWKCALGGKGLFWH